MDNLPPPVSPVRKLLPFLIVFLFFFVLVMGIVLLSRSLGGTEEKPQSDVLQPTNIPTVTSVAFPTIPFVTSGATESGALSTETVGRLAFIKNGDIYHSDLLSSSLLVDAIPSAGDKLLWSPRGNFLLWRPVSQTATPSGVVIYNRALGSQTVLPLTAAEVLDYAWSPNEALIAVVSAEQNYHVDLFLPSGIRFSSPSGQLVTQEAAIRQVLWVNAETLLIAGADGIKKITIDGTISPLVAGNMIQLMKLSPSGNNLLYSQGDMKRSDLFLLSLDTGEIQKLAEIPSAIDMGTTGLTTAVLTGGFLPTVSWLPSDKELLVGYHMGGGLPLVGIYNIEKNMLRIIGFFALAKDDTFIDPFRLIGTRVHTVEGAPVWQVTLFTLEDASALGIIRVIPDAYSPTFFSGE